MQTNILSCSMKYKNDNNIWLFDIIKRIKIRSQADALVIKKNDHHNLIIEGLHVIAR